MARSSRHVCVATSRTFNACPSKWDRMSSPRHWLSAASCASRQRASGESHSHWFSTNAVTRAASGPPRHPGHLTLGHAGARVGAASSVSTSSERPNSALSSAAPTAAPPSDPLGARLGGHAVVFACRESGERSVDMLECIQKTRGANKWGRSAVLSARDVYYSTPHQALPSNLIHRPPALSMLPIALPTPTHPSSRPRSQSSAAPHYAAPPPAQLVELTPVRPKRALRRRLALYGKLWDQVWWGQVGWGQRRGRPATKRARS